MNSCKRHIISVLFLCQAFLCYSQTTIKGQVKDREGVPCSDISVIITTATLPAKTLGYTFTDEKGYYNIEFKSEEKQIRIRFAGFNIQKIETTLPNHSTILNQTVKEESINLKEVNIRADKIRQEGDTLNYNVASFMSGNESSIGEVLKRMPGISVKSTGTIEYKGKPISKFYIEGLDLLKGKYGIATNNLSPSSISTVQVLENHQAIQALKNLNFPDAAAINLKLKDSAKGVFNLIAQLGLGADKEMLWENELVGTYFTRRRQHFITYKGNNDGKNLAKELTTLTEAEATVSKQFVQMEVPLPPGIEQSKYYFNNTNATSVNNIWKTSNGSEINANFTYFNDHEHRQSYDETIYLMPDGTRNTVIEQLASSTTTDKAEGHLSYNRNEEHLYLIDDLHLSGVWERGYGNISDDQKPCSQSINMKTLEVNNKLHWVKRQGEYKGIELFSQTDLGIKPQNLYVHPNLFEDLFSDTDAETDIRQKARNVHFTSNNRLSLLTAWMIGDLRISPAGIFNIEYDGLESNIFSVQTKEKVLSDRKYQNDAVFYNVSSGISLNIGYHINRFHASLSLPVTFNYNYLKQKKQDNRTRSSEFLVEPIATIQYRMNSRWDFSTNYVRNYGRTDMQQLYGGYILNNYRILNRYEADLSKAMYQISTLRINYKDVVNMFFAGASASYTDYQPHVLYGYNLDGALMQSFNQPTEKHGNKASANIRLYKGFFWKSLNMELEGTWFKSQSPQLRQEEEVYYQSQSISLTGKVNIFPISHLSLHYEGAWQWIRSRIKDAGAFPISRTLSNQGTVKLNLSKSLTLSGTINHYYNNQAMGNKSFALMDIGVDYTWKNVHFFLTWDNIFDTEKYTYSYMNNMTRYYSEYRIRPMSVMLKVKFKII